jgi:uncharacterized protein (TIGR02246 family)
VNNSIQEIRDLLRKINNAWLKGNPDELNEFFHPDIVMKGPNFQTFATGRDACVQTYRDFLASAIVKDYQESEPDIDFWQNIAVAVMPWKMTYELSVQEYTESGHDVFTFVREDGKWLAVWRIIVTKPE